MSQPPRISNGRIENLPSELESGEDDRHHTVEVNVASATELIHLDKCKLVVVDGPDQKKELVLDKADRPDRHEREERPRPHGQHGQPISL
jgi:hypothetical protein